MSVARLGDVAELVRGITYKPADVCDYRSEGAVACFRTKNVQKQLNDDDLVGVPERIVKKEKKFVNPGDVLVSSANSWNLVGKCCYVPDLDYRAAAGGFISILRAKSDELSGRYLYHWFSSPAVQCAVRSFGNQTTNISNLDHKRTLNLSLPFPRLSEQKRIADILDAVDALRAKRRESLAQLDAFLQSTFLHMFGDPVTNPMGWESIPFGEVGEFFSGATPSKARQDYWVGIIPWVSPKDMKVSDIYDSKDHVSDDSVAETGLKVLEPGHLLIVIRGMILAHSFPVAINRVPVAINQDMKGIRASGMFCVEYLRECASRLNRWILSQVSSAGHGTRRLDSQAMKRVMVPVPPLELQLQFKSMVNAVEEQRSRIRAHLSELDSFFASLQARAFNGEL